VFDDARIDQFAAMASKPGESPSLVLAHQPAVADDIGGKNGRKPALDPLLAQRFLPEATCGEPGRRAVAYARLCSVCESRSSV